ncbi:MAG TPA: sensor domain-containing protein [Thermoanaerobaculia bacterium]|nr:sensor domain-containing protein [Thermoanaerobaculia bacterium]
MNLESENDDLSFPGALAHFFKAPIRLRTYTNLLFLALAFPMGLFYFVFLSVGLTLGYGLTVVWVGFPILALVFAGSWGMSALERRLAIGLLGAEVPPMAPPPSAAALGFWQRVRAFLSNPVTWKGMGYLLMKLPIGVVCFGALVTALSVSVSLLLVPVVWPWADMSFDVDFGVWQPSTFVGALICGLAGAFFLLLSLNLLNGLAYVLRQLATAMLGSSRYTSAPPAPSLTGMSGEPAPATA